MHGKKNFINFSGRLHQICFSTSNQSHITGSAVALHCCKAHSKLIGKMENSTPCKIVLNGQNGRKGGTAILHHYAKFCRNHFNRGRDMAIVRFFKMADAAMLDL